MIEFTEVELKYHYDEYAVLKNLSFTLTDGINTILCDSQSGKSSICKLLTKQFKPTRGKILLNGEDISSIGSSALGILYIPSIPTFFERRSVKYNVTYPLKVRKASRSERDRRFEEVVKQVGLENGDIKIKKLSMPERKRVALARGLTISRNIVLLDDFCESAEQVDKVASMFENAMIVVLTSDVSLAKGNVVVLDGGNTVYQGDAIGAIECRKGLQWIVDILRSE